MTAVAGPAATAPRWLTGARARALNIATAVRRYDLAVLLAGLLLLFGLVRGWLQSNLRTTLSARQLGIVLPGTDQRPFSWGYVIALALVLVIVALTPWGRPRPVLVQAAAILATTAVVGFGVQGWLVDQALQRRLRADYTDLDNLRRVAGFIVPRPRVTTVGPIPLPTGAADLVSGLRSGFYVAALGAILLIGIAIRRRRSAVEPGSRRWTRVTLAATGLLVLAIGISLVAASSGQRSTDPRAVSAITVSRVQRDAGHDLNGLRTLSTAIQAQPGNDDLRTEFDQQAINYLLSRGASNDVHVLLLPSDDSALVRLALARTEVVNGENPAAITDARAAIALAEDTEVRSVALTFMAVAQQRSGDPVTARRTLLAAVEADTDYVNVMARSLLTGLYATLPL